MSSSKQGEIILNEEELDYEYSDDEDERISIISECSSECEIYLSSNLSSPIECEDCQNQTRKKKCTRLFSNVSKVHGSYNNKNRWRHHNKIGGYLKRWRIRSSDQVFHKSRCTNKIIVPESETTENLITMEEIQHISDLSVIINNDLCALSTAKNSLCTPSIPVTTSADQFKCINWNSYRTLSL